MRSGVHHLEVRVILKGWLSLCHRSPARGGGIVQPQAQAWSDCTPAKKCVPQKCPERQLSRKMPRCAYFPSADADELAALAARALEAEAVGDTRRSTALMRRRLLDVDNAQVWLWGRRVSWQSVHAAAMCWRHTMLRCGCGGAGLAGRACTQLPCAGCGQCSGVVVGVHGQLAERARSCWTQQTP